VTSSNYVIPRRYDMDIALGGDMDFQFFHRWFNGLFLASASIAILVYYLQHKASMNDPLLPTHKRTGSWGSVG